MSETKKASSIVKAGSKGYGYNYASLTDIVNAGHDIPKMRIKAMDNGLQFIEYLDGNEWQLGAQIVTEFKGAGMNACQAYGSALSYARRYTAQMALSLAVDDDKNVETAGDKTKASNYIERNATTKQIETLKSLLGDNYQAVADKNKPLTIGKASKLISAIQAKKQTESTKAEPVSDETQPISIDDIPF